MSIGDIAAVTDQLAHTRVDGNSVLSFAKQGLKLDSAEDAKQIIDALDGSSSVETFVLDGNTLGVEAAKAIGQSLEKHPELKNALWSDMFTGRLKSEIPEALQYLGNGIMKAGANLVELDLSDNAFGPNGMKGLVELLQSESCFSLQKLRLHNNGLGTTGGKMLAECLLECHTRSVAKGQPLALRVFQSGRGRLENVGATALAEAFKAMGSLEEVVMPQNGIYHEGISALADAFTVNKNLKHVNLQDNTFTEKGALAMAKPLGHLQNLETINFGDCLLKTKGAIILAKSLMGGHAKLKILNLSFNEIGPRGAVSLAEAIEDKESLERFELDGNQLGEDGKELIQGTLEAIGKLELLGSLSEDEGTEEENEEEVEDYDAEEIEPEDVEEGEELADPTLQIQGLALTPRADKVATAAEFLQFPSPTKLRQLGPDKGKAIVDHLGNSIDDIEVSIQTIMRMCTVVTVEDNTTKEAACECADAVFLRLLSSDDQNKASAVSNVLLVHMGLIKSEDKKFKPTANIRGALIVMEHVAKQQYFPKLSKDILACFVSRPHPLIDQCMDQKHLLLAALHR